MRKRRAEKKFIKPDPKYDDVMVAKFINSIMIKGKKSTARKVIYSAFDIIEKRTKKSGVDIFKLAITNTQPLIEVRSRRVGGATYQVPTEVRPERRTALAMRWIKTYAKQRSEKSASQKIAMELIAASNNEGSAIKKKEDTHKMAEANKAFAHFKW
ncbi:30S ribosomal protein S7 [bacterium BMS3Abin03]|jgi:small subunit ribosomal protein S7|nr:30S ribosomal protein S7 [bacterium BMS3Abin03]MCG6959491.1 30S ribosomal protein S7 [bacterium BMS3Abin03]